MARYRLTKGTHSAFVDGERTEYVAGRKGHDIMELTEEQAKLPHFRRRVERLHESSALDFTPDDEADNESATESEAAPTLHVLAGNEKQVLAYIEEHSDDEDALTALRDAETNGKRRKKIMETLNELLDE